MSYPRKLHILIIEDEQDPIDEYQELLPALGETYPYVEPAVVRSFDDALDYINGPNVVHLVILDLNLPYETRQQPPDGIDPGQQLLALLAQREEYPVPAVLIVSARLQLARLTELQTRLEKEFWYGALVNKGIPTLGNELSIGLQKAQEYCDVGIHVAGADKGWYPPLTPREEDLLRRCVLSQPGCLGVDLHWWSAESAPTFSRLAEYAGPTKVLMGSFLLDDGMGASRPTFFKFEPSASAPATSRDAAILDQKLRHVQVKCSLPSHTRFLLVTQSVTDGTPVPLNVYLSGAPAEVTPTLPALVGDVLAQLDQLGMSTDGQTTVRQLLWEWHERNRIDEALQRFQPSSSAIGDIDPLSLFDMLKTSDRLVWVGKRLCTHGDLNATNVAVDFRDGERPHAFVFDAAGVGANTDTRDLAMLEITSLLFNPDLVRSLQEGCLDLLYGQTFVPEGLEKLDVPPSVQNTIQFIVLLRREIEQQDKTAVYALMVFDIALMQLGGLAVQPSRNKITDPAFCSAVANVACEWLLRFIPELMRGGTDSDQDVNID